LMMINISNHNHKIYMVSLSNIELGQRNLRLVLEDLELEVHKT
jgi:hypothetical protein